MTEGDLLAAWIEAATALEQAVADARQAAADAHNERDTLLASTSWRLTAPLRALVRRARRQKPSPLGKGLGEGPGPKRPLLPALTQNSLTPGAPITALLANTEADHLLILAPGAQLTPGALPRLQAELLLHPGADLLYADESTPAGPYRKPAWSLDLALEQDLTGPFAVLRRPLLESLASDRQPPTVHDLALLATPRTIHHIPTILAHRAEAPPPAPASCTLDRLLAAMPTAPSRPTLIPSRYTGHPRLRWHADPPPRASILIPTRDQARLLARCTEGLLHRTDYPDLELLILDNGSTAPDAQALLARLAQDPRIRVLAMPGPFNYAALNNAAAAQATGDLLVLLNNDIDILDPAWLSELAGHAMRPEIGAVGARLLFENGTIQHAGIVGGVGAFEGGPGVAGHFGFTAPGADPGHGGQFIHTREVLAVTGACLALRAEIWRRAGGLDAENLSVALNDLDLCLKIRALGLRIVWTPFVELLHLQSASRGADDTPANAERFRRECRHLRDRWGPVLDADPFYNPAFSRFDHSFQPADHRDVPLVTNDPIR